MRFHSFLFLIFFSYKVNGFFFKMNLEHYKDELAQTASKLASKGILAMDESPNTIKKRFESIGIENTIENRRDYREILITCPYIDSYISGMIFHNETLYQSLKNETSFVEYLQMRGIIPGIKVDRGLETLIGGYPNETFTIGLEGLFERTIKYYDMGVRFAKWRSLFRIQNNNCPSSFAIKENSWELARYARICQESGLVPIIECEILMEGYHSIEKSYETQKKILSSVYDALKKNNVLLEGTLLKPSFTIQGPDNNELVSSSKVSKLTLKNLEENVPASVPGVMFLSGGLSEREASIHLNAINSMKRKKPFSLSFCYGRALQNECLNTWMGKKENIKNSQIVLLHRAKRNYDAMNGKL